jgi:hypothetical protein
LFCPEQKGGGGRQGALLSLLSVRKCTKDYMLKFLANQTK